jgi:nickel-dependent lactate racemase
VTAQVTKTQTPIGLPYGEGHLAVDPLGPAVHLGARPSPPLTDIKIAARNAISCPADGPSLEQVARGVNRAVVLIADATRNLPQESMLEAVLEVLEGIEVTLLVGSGLHGPSPLGALGLSEATLARLPIHQHEADDHDNLVDLGPLRHTFDLDASWSLAQTALGMTDVWRRLLRRGTAGGLFRGLLAIRAASVNRLWVNRLCAEADLIVALGQITPHFLTGYSGGIKTVVPGAAGRSTIVGNHLKILHSSARLGFVEGNVVRQELESATALLPPIFILNAVPASDGRPESLVAGDPIGAHRAGVKRARAIYEIETPQTEAVIVGASNPKALNLYQLLKVLPAAARVVRPGGGICVAGPCPGGIGPSALVRQIIFPCYMEALLPRGVELLLLSRMPKKLASSATPFKPVASVDEAVSRLRERAGPDGLMAVMDGSGPIVPLLDGYRAESLLAEPEKAHPS